VPKNKLEGASSRSAPAWGVTAVAQNTDAVLTCSSTMYHWHIAWYVAVPVQSLQGRVQSQLVHVEPHASKKPACMANQKSDMTTLPTCTTFHAPTSLVTAPAGIHAACNIAQY
jgi:hypothetical protein